MLRLKCSSILLYRYGIFCRLRNFHLKPESIVIVAAARTPWGKYQGQLSSLTAWQLGQLVVDSVVKQSAIPVNQIQQIFMNETPKLLLDSENEFIFSRFLKKAKYEPFTLECGDEPKIKSFLEALKYLKVEKKSAVVVGGIESATQNELNQKKPLNKNKSSNQIFNEDLSEIAKGYAAKNMTKYTKSLVDAAFDSEIVPLTVQQIEGKRKIQRKISQDEFFSVSSGKCINSLQYGDVAAAFVLTTLANAQELQLFPLAIIIDFEYLHCNSNNVFSRQECIEKLFHKVKIDHHQIQHWEIEDLAPQFVDFLKDHLNLNSDLINPHGGSLSFGHSSASSLARSITHLTHSLNATEYGCLISTKSDESLVLIIQKLTSSFVPQQLPLVTLYTRDPCPLCDILVEELELFFPGEYELEKVFIDTKDNLRFLQLYRLDIPVVFLNKQFLCMHRLNHKLLRKRLDLLKQN